MRLGRYLKKIQPCLQQKGVILDIGKGRQPYSVYEASPSTRASDVVGIGGPGVPGTEQGGVFPTISLPAPDDLPQLTCAARSYATLGGLATIRQPLYPKYCGDRCVSTIAGCCQ